MLKGYRNLNKVFDNDEINYTNGYMFTLVDVYILEIIKAILYYYVTIEYEFIALEMVNDAVDWLRNLLVALWGGS